MKADLIRITVCRHAHVIRAHQNRIDQKACDQGKSAVDQKVEEGEAVPGQAQGHDCGRAAEKEQRSRIQSRRECDQDQTQNRRQRELDHGGIARPAQRRSGKSALQKLGVKLDPRQSRMDRGDLEIEQTRGRSPDQHHFAGKAAGGHPALQKIDGGNVPAQVGRREMDPDAAFAVGGNLDRIDADAPDAAGIAFDEDGA